MEFSRPEYGSREPFPSPGNLPSQGMEPRSPALQADSLPTEPHRKPYFENGTVQIPGITLKTSLEEKMQSMNQLLYLHILCAVLCLVTQLCLTLCDPVIVAHQVPLSMGILQARILERVAMPSSGGSSQPRAWTHISHIADRFFTSWATREALQWNELCVKVFRIRQAEHCSYIFIHSKWSGFALRSVSMA